MEAGVIIATLLLVLLLFTIIKRAIFSLPKWKIVYYGIIRDLNDGEDEQLIKDDLVDRYKLTPEQAEAAVLAAKNGDIEWFENSIWR